MEKFSTQAETNQDATHSITYEMHLESLFLLQDVDWQHESYIFQKVFIKSKLQPSGK